jgi:hypothetical protein
LSAVHAYIVEAPAVSFPEDSGAGSGDITQHRHGGGFDGIDEFGGAGDAMPPAVTKY